VAGIGVFKGGIDDVDGVVGVVVVVELVVFEL